MLTDTVITNIVRYIFNFLFIHLFLAVVGLCCCVRALSTCGTEASHCSGIACHGARVLRRAGFSSCSTRAQ